MSHSELLWDSCSSCPAWADLIEGGEIEVAVVIHQDLKNAGKEKQSFITVVGDIFARQKCSESIEQGAAGIGGGKTEFMM